MTHSFDPIAQLRARLAQAERMLHGFDRPVTPRARGSRVTAIDAGLKGAVALECQAQLRNEILRIEAALTRMDGDLYGLCTRCKLPIEEARLHEDATILFCNDCVEETLRRSRRPAARSRN